MPNVKETGQGTVKLISGGGKVFTDIAARICHSERSVEDICNSPYCANIVKNILNSGHLAATEFDYFIFAIEGYSRVTEVQLVRKRLASYLISSGRDERNGKRAFNLVIPPSTNIPDGVKIYMPDYGIDLIVGNDFMAELNEQYYNGLVENGVPEEDARYWKPQGTEFKAIIGMNAHALIEWTGIRCCKNAQHEIRDLANKMLSLAREVSPDLFSTAGPRCVQLGYCPENERQHPDCQGKIKTKNEALAAIKEHSKIKETLKKVYAHYEDGGLNTSGLMELGAEIQGYFKE